MGRARAMCSKGLMCPDVGAGCGWAGLETDTITGTGQAPAPSHGPVTARPSRRRARRPRRRRRHPNRCRRRFRFRCRYLPRSCSRALSRSRCRNHCPSRSGPLNWTDSVVAVRERLVLARGAGAQRRVRVVYPPRALVLVVLLAEFWVGLVVCTSQGGAP